MTKTCKQCGQVKPYNAEAKYWSKASGFYGATCWDCYRQHKQALCKTARKSPEVRAQANYAARVWQRDNPGKANALAIKYLAAKLQRLPAWANLKAIEQIYIQSRALGLTVDHIYPLQGKLVSGLHVDNNLQLLSSSANSSKGNKMPQIYE